MGAVPLGHDVSSKFSCRHAVVGEDASFVPFKNFHEEWSTIRSKSFRHNQWVLCRSATTCRQNSVAATRSWVKTLRLFPSRISTKNGPRSKFASVAQDRRRPKRASSRRGHCRGWGG